MIILSIFTILCFLGAALMQSLIMIRAGRTMLAKRRLARIERQISALLNADIVLPVSVVNDLTRHQHDIKEFPLVFITSPERLAQVEAKVRSATIYADF